nr:hypothetical protein [uncultured Methanobacterium sp.]
MTITGTKGKTVEGTQPALDITDILNKNAGLQTLQLVLKDTDLGFIGTSPLYVVQATLEKESPQDGHTDELPPVFACPAPTWPPLPWNGTNPSYNPFAYPPSEIPIDMNGVVDIFWKDVLHSSYNPINPGVYSGPEIHYNPNENSEEISIPCWYNSETGMVYVYKIIYYY